jgi:hypothetical protein
LAACTTVAWQSWCWLITSMFWASSAAAASFCLSGSHQFEVLTR